MHRNIFIIVSLLATLTVAGPMSSVRPFAASVASAQDEESSPSIDLGSSRIGGPGLTARERRWVKSLSQPEEGMTETNIPPPGNKKRLPHLHYLAKNYVNGKAWKDACAKYDLIIEEGGVEALEVAPFAKRYAARAYFFCGKIAYAGTDFDKAERLLIKSERFGPSSPRHEALRLKMKRDRYRKKLVDGDVNGALKLFNEAQKEDESEDERIWFGEQLAALASNAYKSGDTYRTEELMRKLEVVAPQNVEYRKLKARIEGQASVFTRLAQVVGVAIVFVVGWNLLSAWRARARLKVGPRNPFDDDEDL